MSIILRWLLAARKRGLQLINLSRRKNYRMKREKHCQAWRTDLHTVIICADYQMAKLDTGGWVHNLGVGTTYRRSTMMCLAWLTTVLVNPWFICLTNMQGWRTPIIQYLTWQITSPNCQVGSSVCTCLWTTPAVPTRITISCPGHWNGVSREATVFFVYHSSLQDIRNSHQIFYSPRLQSYNRSDVFNTNELKDIISDYAEVIVDDGTLVCDWREILSEKYSKIPGIWQLHDFIFVKHPTTLCVVAGVQELCYTGSFREFTSHVLSRKDDYMPFWSRYAELCLFKEN